jgi:hypothetical protein
MQVSERQTTNTIEMVSELLVDPGKVHGGFAKSATDHGLWKSKKQRTGP